MLSLHNKKTITVKSFLSFTTPVLLFATICLSSCGTTSFADNSNLGPSSYELKFVLDPDKVLDKDNHLKEDYINEFDFSSKNHSTNEVIYLETPNRDFIDNDWINRLRQEGHKDKIERTYKKRYPLSDNKLTTIQDAMASAKKDGFDVTGTADLKKTEVDWGYSNMTLSFSLEEDTKDPYPYPARLAKYTSQQATAFAAETMPLQERNCKYKGWGLETMEQAGMAGPLKYQKYEKGKIYDVGKKHDGKKNKRKKLIKEKVRIEIWPIPNTLTGQNEDYMVELSLKIKQKKDDSPQEIYDKAAYDRKLVNDLLDKEGILIKADSLKTSATLNAYTPIFTPDPQ